MSGLETAIRNALARSERANAEVRARIYQSARNALEAGLRKQEVNDPETITAQRHRLEATIHQIESEERAQIAATARDVRVEPVVEVRPEPVLRAERDVRPERDARPEPTIDAEPRMDAERTPAAASHIGAIRPDREDGFAAGAAPVSEKNATASQASDFRPERVAKARKRRGRLFSFLLVVATLIAAFGALAWWVQTSGLLDDLQNADDSTPPARVSGEDFSGEDPIKKALDTQSRFSSDWRAVFSPGDTAKLSASAAGRFESISTSEGPAVRVTSTDADRDGAVRIEVSPDVLGEMGGKTSTVALTVQAAGDKPVQVAVDCDFSTMGGCGRHRFTVSERTDILFQVEFDRSLSPSEPGHLLLNSDITGGSGSINLYAVRILPGE
ncbi:biotin transporter BioY [Shinella sp. G-2]|uniref:biotin transporter BioY n=1 Tax=Shinella sp. G-2 TaxID=3133141 RepID=UPI003D057EB1